MFLFLRRSERYWLPPSWGREGEVGGDGLAVWEELFSCTLLYFVNIVSFTYIIKVTHLFIKNKPGPVTRLGHGLENTPVQGWSLLVFLPSKCSQGLRGSEVRRQAFMSGYGLQIGMVWAGGPKDVHTLVLPSPLQDTSGQHVWGRGLRRGPELMGGDWSAWGGEYRKEE